MIATLTSPAAQVARNAEAKIAQITKELADLQDQAEQARGEMRELLAERDSAQARRADLAATVEACRADVQTAELAEEMAGGTTLAPAARETTQRASALWDAARQDLQAHDEAWGERAAQLDERLSFLERSISEAAQMSQSQQAKLLQLRAVYDQAHSDHGADEQAQLEKEFAALAEKRAAIQQQLTAVDQEEQALCDQIPSRLKDWPNLAREALGQHLDYQPGAWVQMLRLWQELAELAGNEPKAIDEQTWAAYIGQTTLHLWYLREFGPKAKIVALPERHRDEPLKAYLKMLDNLAATLKRLEGQERSRQVDKQMQAKREEAGNE